MPNIELQSDMTALELVKLLHSDEWKKPNEQISRAAIVQRGSRCQNPHIQEGGFPGRIPSQALLAINNAIKDKPFNELDHVLVGIYTGDEKFRLAIVKNDSPLHALLESAQNKTGSHESKAIFDHRELRIEDNSGGEEIPPQRDFSLYEINAKYLSGEHAEIWRHIKKILD